MASQWLRQVNFSLSILKAYINLEDQIYFDALGKHGTLGMMSLLFIVQFLMGLSILVAASRQSWAFSRDGALPFSRFFRPISQKFGYIPLRTIWGCVFLAAIMGLLSLIAPAAAQALFSLAVAGNNLAWGIPIFARVVWGQKKFKPGPFYTGDRLSVPIAWVAITFLVFGTLLSMFPVEGPGPTRKSFPPAPVLHLWPSPTIESSESAYLHRPPAQNMNYTVVINSAVWFGALGYYYIDARKWFTGPKITIDTDDLTEAQQKAIAEDGLEDVLHPKMSGDGAAAAVEATLRQCEDMSSSRLVDKVWQFVIGYCDGWRGSFFISLVLNGGVY